MRTRRLMMIGIGAGVVAACNVRIETFRPHDAAPDTGAEAADAAPDVAPDTSGVISLRAYVKASNTGAEDAFGQSVALSRDGSRLAIGAYGEDSSGTCVDGNQNSEGAPSAGAVYVFARNGMTWRQEAYVKPCTVAEDDRFGTSIALSGDGLTLAVGAASEDKDATGTGTAFAAGAVYVFTYDGTRWDQQAYVKASNAGAGDIFGTTVALSHNGSTLAVGATEEDSDGSGQADNSVDGAGAVYVFTRNGTWTQQAYLKASGPEGLDHFGESLALSDDGDTLAVGASKPTKITVFARTGTAWTQQFQQSGVILPYFNSVALSGDGDTLAVGVPLEDDAAPSAGAVYVSTRNNATWSQPAPVGGVALREGDQFGQSVSLSEDGMTLAVGADGSADRHGAVYLLTRSEAMWTQRAYVTARTGDIGDQFGQRVALSRDGATLAVGAGAEDSAARGIDGNDGDDAATNAGAAYIFR